MKEADDQQQQASTSTTIDDLPSEILYPIIGCLSYNERLNVAKVSRRWYSFIDSNFGRKLFVGRLCQFSRDDKERDTHHYVPIQTLPKVGVNTCYVGEIVEPVKSMSNLCYYWNKLRETLFGPNIPTFKHPHLVKNIFFDGPIPSKYFDALIRPTRNLERLDIHLSSLCNLNPANMELPTKNKLETLNIWGYKLTQGTFTSFYSTKDIISNLLNLLEQNHFESLKNVGIEYPFDLRDETKVTVQVLKFLQAHMDTIEKFKICINLFITEDPNDSMVDPEDRVWVQKAKAASKTLTLKDIQVVIASSVRLTKIWIGFIEAQTALESVKVTTFRLLPDILYRICEENHKSLVKLSLTRLVLNENGRFTPINCSVFQDCLNLKGLFLEAIQTGLQTPGLLETRNLPSSLERIEFLNILILCEDVSDLLVGLPGLQEVCLIHAGRANDFGATAATINQLIQNHTIRNVNLIKSLNGALPIEGIPNGNPRS